MNMTESQVFEAFGLAPGDTGGNTPAVAAPAGQEQAGTLSGEGGKEWAVAGSAPDEKATEQTGTPTAEETPSTSKEGEEHGDPDKESEERPNRSPEASSDDEKRARADAAARRRRQEQRIAIDRALEAEREKHRSELNAVFQAAGLKNTVTGAPVTNMYEFYVWAANRAKTAGEPSASGSAGGRRNGEAYAESSAQAGDGAERTRSDTGNLTPEGLEQAISNSPSMQRMKQLLERDEKARQEQAAAAAKVKIEAELQEIHKMDPSINTTEDLLNMPAAKEFYEYVRKGNTFLDAFYLANRQRLTAEAAEAAKQQTLNAARSKDHLQPSGTSRGAGAISVPAEELELFRLLNPQATDSEIQAYYNKTKR